ncbi:MAG: polysaccharide export protein [Deltaproteobacteria bacterium]|nr:polysaccharide export protein [Deltaproteobacteria bacterium]
MKKKIICMLGLMLLVSLVGYARAQENYRLGPEDEIQIRVWDNDDLTRKTRIDLNGMISFPFVGQIKAGGLTVLELQKELIQRLGPKYIINPHINVTVTEFKSQKFFVVGNVQKPGTYPLTKNITVVEAISLAGGVSAATSNKPASSAIAIIVRARPGSKPEQPRLPNQSRPEEKVTVSLAGALAGDPKQNLEIRNGDTINVPNLVYYVTGEVKSAGRFPYDDEQMTVLMAVTTAGGFSDKASARRTYIIREEAGNKQKIKAGMDSLIRPGDTIVVPESWF